MITTTPRDSLTSRRKPSLLACLAVALLVLSAALPGLSRAGAPRRPLTLNVAAHTLGGLRLGADATAFTRRWGYPSDTRAFPIGTFVSWVSTMGPWAVVEFPAGTERGATSLYYAGPLRTTRGDHLGVSLATFRKHWPQAHASKRKLRWARRFDVGPVSFFFGLKKAKLIGVQLGIGDAADIAHPLPAKR